MWQFFHPFSFRVIQSLLKPIDYCLVNSFSLPIALWIGGSGISVSYTQFRTIFSKGIAIELESIIRNKSSRNSKSCNNVLPDKPLHIYVPDVRQGLSFNPFGEVVCADQQILLVSYGFRKKADNVQPPLRKRPRA